MKEVAENRSLNSKESVDNFISDLRYRIPTTQLSGKATALMKNSLLKAIEQTQKIKKQKILSKSDKKHITKKEKAIKIICGFFDIL